MFTSRLFLGLPYLLLIATASYQEASSPSTLNCNAGQCFASEEVRNSITEADDLPDSALGFIQKGLSKKKREMEVSKVARVNQTSFSNATKGVNRTSDTSRSHPAVAVADAARSKEAPFRTKFSPCLLEGSAASTNIPSSTQGLAEIEAFTHFGLINPRPTCSHSELPSFSSFMPAGYDVEARNRMAQWAIMIWGVFAGSMIVWSLASVSLVPRKKDREGVSAQKMSLADEDSAFAQGFFNWVSLAWVDDLVGRYGKCLHAVIDDKEVVLNRQDDKFKPYVEFRELWSEEVKAKGSAEHASMVKTLYKLVGFKGTALLVGAVVIEEFFSNVGMVWALEKFLNNLELMQAQRKANPGAPMDYFEPTLQIVILLWGVPMMYRFSIVIVSLLDGYYTNKCAAGLASIVFEKAMNMPAGSTTGQQQETPTAEAPEGDQPNVIQLLNIDIIEVWGYLLRDILYTILSPLTIIVLFAMMFHQIKTAGLVGACYLIPATVLVVILLIWTLSWWQRYQRFQDTRLKWLTESMIHIRTIKSLAWEKLSFKKLHEAREAELVCNQRCFIIGGGVMSVIHSLPWGFLLITLWFTLVTEGSVQAHKIVILQRIIASLLAVIGQLMSGIKKMTTVPNSFRRVKRYLDQKERPKDIVRQPALGNPNAPIVRLRGSFTFLEDSPPVLTDLDVAIPRGELVGVVGGVASGKSAFLQAIIGELYPCKGSLVEAPLPGTGAVAYCPQVPWIFEGTLRENVIMEQALEQDRYYEALHAAALTSDLQILPGGDQVTIGSYGIRLSGGQRARVALARAAYMSSSEVVVIDDPFASVDIPTGQHICNELLLGPVMRGRTRIVVTQPNPSRLRNFDRLLLIEGGKVIETGPPAEVIQSKAFQKLLAEGSDSTDMADDQAGQKVSGSANTAAMMVKQKGSEPANQLRDAEAQDHITWKTLYWWLQAAGWVNIAVFVGIIMIQRTIEMRESLVVAVWIDTKMANPYVDDRIFMVRVLMVVMLACLVTVFSQYACSRVSVSASRLIHQNVMKAILRAPVDKFFDKQPIGRLINRLSFDIRQVDDGVTMSLFAMLLFIVGFIVTQSFILRVVPTKIAVCSIPFFLTIGFYIYLYRGVAVPLVFHSKFALSNMQDLQSVILSCSVPIRANGMFGNFVMRYNHYCQSVIRSQYLIHHVCKAWVHSRVFLCFGALTCLFALGGLWSDMPMGTLATVITFSFAQMSEFENMSTGFTSFLNVLNAIQRLSRYMNVPQEAEPEMPGDPVVRLRPKVERTEMAALELKRGQDAKEALAARSRAMRRNEEEEVSTPELVVCIKGGPPILRATADGLALELLPNCRMRDLAPHCEALRELQDPFQIIAVNSVSRSSELIAQELANPISALNSALWLDLWNCNFAQGMSVKLEDLCAGYGSEKSVLHSVSLEIEPRMKVGFAGKTGCGKSTTLLCILRLLEPRSGRILIGGRDTSKLGLSTLRSMVGLVPQDPTVFEGTWRFNIDPFGEFPDGRIWEALQCVQLMPFMRSLKDGIDSEITRDGGNLSFGQRQLLSLARMVVRQPPVLLLDECTSALDPSTQEAAQRTVLNDFPRTTVIAIAHRVETILDFDRVIVFDQGTVAEKGTIDEVCKIENGIFAKMVKAHRSN
eukprot:TRINITY_DN1546_c0_g1_i2.p1 TRINITY_DN1546_c0_g1~~TRINITY_DN1546_c0_g1_i2.p1  ORF type:complete len:1631 (+),score=308.62 TRINITY_DN1546_c0_g1_i2:121-5013(+)